MAASNELTSMAATMRMASAMEKSSEVMAQMNSLVKCGEVADTMKEMSREMFKAGLIDEVMDDAMADMDGEEMEEEAEAEMDKVLESCALDAAARMKVLQPEKAKVVIEQAAVQKAEEEA